MDYTYFTNTPFAIMHSSLALVFINCRYRSIAAKQITLWASFSTESEIICLSSWLNIHFTEKLSKQKFYIFMSSIFYVTSVSYEPYVVTVDWHKPN